MSDHYYTNKPQSSHELKEITATVGNHNLRLTTDSGVFSKNRMDFGSKLLVESFLKTRIFDENRPDKKYILSTLNLINYDPLLIAQKTHGILFQDEIWLHFNNESFSWREAYAILQS